MKHLGRLFLAILLFSSVLLAQTDEGRILGTITDATGSVVVGARVTITHTATGVNRVLTTNSVGDYSAPALKPGNYVVSAEFAGFKKAVSTTVILEVAREVRVDLRLFPGASTRSCKLRRKVRWRIPPTPR